MPKNNDIGRMRHGIGLQLTEPPSITIQDQTILEENMVIAIEPCLEYAPGTMIVQEENILITKNGLNDFNLSNPGFSLFLILAGPMTVIPLFLYVRGVELIALGPTGMIFYITPTLQFILGYFYYNEEFSFIKFVSFIIIWIAVIIYLKDLYETN